VYSSFLGGSGREGILGIALDPSGNAYVAGWTNSSDFPTTPGTLDATCGTDGLCDLPYYDAFVTKLNAAGSGLVYSTYLGGSRGEAVEDIAVDSWGIAFLTGSTASMDFPLNEDIDNTCGGTDAFVAKLSANGAGLIFSTFLGGGLNEGAKGIAIDAFRDVYVAGFTASHDFTATPGAYDTTYGSDGSYGEWKRDGFIAKLSGLALPLTDGSPRTVDFGEQPVGTTSNPRTVTITNIGDAPQPIPPLDISGDFGYTPHCGTGIAPGSSCTIDFTFTPTGVGSRTGQLLAYDEDNEQWETVLPLSGVGVFPEELSLTIDIKPGTEENSINTKTHGVVPVAILGDSVFNVDLLDVTTLRFGPNGAAPAHDLTDPIVYAMHRQDVDGDGYFDLVCHFRQQETGIALGDTEACIRGYTHDTGNGPIPATGCGSVRTVR
jgi:hypothetical protein